MKKVMISMCLFYTCISISSDLQEGSYTIDLITQINSVKIGSNSNLSVSMDLGYANGLTRNSTVETVKNICINHEIFPATIGQFYIAYATKKGLKFKSVPDTTLILGLLQQYEKPYLTPFPIERPNRPIKPYQHPHHPNAFNK